MAIESMYVFTGDEVIATDLPAKLNENFAKTETNMLKTVNNVAQDENHNINVTELIPKQITSNTNLNNLVTSGEYTFTKGSATITNSPTSNSFFLTVLKNNALVKQVVTEVVLDDPITYTRVLSGSSWSPWVEGGKVKTINNISPDDSGNVFLNLVESLEKNTEDKLIVHNADGTTQELEVGKKYTINGKLPDSTDNYDIKVSDLENDAGYLTKHQSFEYEKYASYVISGAASQPASSVMQYTATGAFTLNLSSISSKLAAKEATVFTTYIKSNADYPLTITNAGTIKYIGSASDVAITSAGLLLNIMMMKDNSGNLTSLVQASKLS